VVPAHAPFGVRHTGIHLAERGGAWILRARATFKVSAGQEARQEALRPSDELVKLLASRFHRWPFVQRQDSRLWILPSPQTTKDAKIRKTITHNGLTTVRPFVFGRFSTGKTALNRKHKDKARTTCLPVIQDRLSALHTLIRPTKSVHACACSSPNPQQPHVGGQPRISRPFFPRIPLTACEQ
jgi:hypothetical protein